MLPQVSYQYRNSSLLVVLFQKQTWVDDVGDLELRELAIKTADCLKFEERNRLQTKLVADYRCQPTMDE